MFMVIRVRFRESKAGLNSRFFFTERSKAVLLLQFFSVCPSVDNADKEAADQSVHRGFLIRAFLVRLTSRKHIYIILTPFYPILCSKTGVYRGIHYFSYFCSKT